MPDIDHRHYDLPFFDVVDHPEVSAPSGIGRILRRPQLLPDAVRVLGQRTVDELCTCCGYGFWQLDVECSLSLTSECDPKGHRRGQRPAARIDASTSSWV